MALFVCHFYEGGDRCEDIDLKRNQADKLSKPKQEETLMKRRIISCMMIAVMLIGNMLPDMKV